MNVRMRLFIDADINDYVYICMNHFRSYHHAYKLKNATQYSNATA